MAYALTGKALTLKGHNPAGVALADVAVDVGNNLAFNLIVTPPPALTVGDKFTARVLVGTTPVVGATQVQAVAASMLNAYGEATIPFVWPHGLPGVAPGAAKIVVEDGAAAPVAEVSVTVNAVATPQPPGAAAPASGSPPAGVMHQVWYAPDGTKVLDQTMPIFPPSPANQALTVPGWVRWLLGLMVVALLLMSFATCAGAWRMLGFMAAGVSAYDKGPPQRIIQVQAPAPSAGAIPGSPAPVAAPEPQPTPVAPVR